MGVDFDKILADVGGKGKYQMIRYFLLAAVPIAMSWHLVGNALISAAPKHTCIPSQYSKEFPGTHISADYQCLANEKLGTSMYNSLIEYADKIISELETNQTDTRTLQLHNMFVADTSKTSEKECSQVNYNKWTNNFKDEKKSAKVCQILKHITDNGLTVDSTVTETKGGEEVERQKTSAEILAEYDSKVDLIGDQACYKLYNKANKLYVKDCIHGLNDIRICDGEGCYSDTVPCESWEYEQIHYKRTAVTEFNLVCGDVFYQQGLQIGVMIGVFIGAIGFGSMSDTKGRKPCVMTALITAFFGMLLGGFAPNYWVLFACRVINGAGAIGAISAAFVLTGEIFDPDSKVMALQVAQALFGVGQALLALIGYYVADWRYISMILAIPTATGFFIPCILDESARWLISKKRINEADAVLHKMAAQNGNRFQGLAYHQVTQESCEDEDDSKQVESAGLKDFFRTPRMRMRTLNLFYQWFMLSGVYYALTINATSLGGDPFLNLGISGLSEVPAELLAGVLFMKIGRRLSMIIFNFFGGFFCLLMMFAEPNSTSSIVFPLLGKFFLTGGYGGIYVYTAELFPTVIRNAGIGYCSAVARIGGIMAPVIFMLGPLIHPVLPYIIFGFSGIFGAVCAVFLPEVLDRTLPDSILEGEEFGKGEPSALEDIKRMVAGLFRTAETTRKYNEVPQ